MRRKYQISNMFLLQLAIGLYFSVAGILEILGFNSDVNQAVQGISKLFGKSNYLPLIVAICLLITGLILLFGVVIPLKIRVIYSVILVLWIVYIIVNYFTDGFLKPNFIHWLKDLSYQLIILAGLWNIAQKR